MDLAGKFLVIDCMDLHGQGLHDVAAAERDIFQRRLAPHAGGAHNVVYMGAQEALSVLLNRGAPSPKAILISSTDPAYAYGDDLADTLRSRCQRQAPGKSLPDMIPVWKPFADREKVCSLFSLFVNEERLDRALDLVLQTPVMK